MLLCSTKSGFAVPLGQLAFLRVKNESYNLLDFLAEISFLLLQAASECGVHAYSLQSKSISLC
jgi:hypothetical protein